MGAEEIRRGYRNGLRSRREADKELSDQLFRSVLSQDDDTDRIERQKRFWLALVTAIIFVWSVWITWMIYKIYEHLPR